jgi:hypothetical protein
LCFSECNVKLLYMIKLLVAAIVLLTCSAVAIGQNLRGGFGHAYFGTAFNVSPGIQKDLSASSILGNGIQLNRFAKFGGGGGYALLSKRIMLGGSGFGYKVSDATARGQATVSMGGGFVNIGYMVVSRNNMLSFPYIGIGGNGMKMKLSNDTQDESFDLGNKVIGPGEYKDLRSGGVSFEIGYALKFLTFSVKETGGHGGFMVGVQAGTYLFAGMERWHEQPSEDMISKFSTPYSFSPYLRITIGGGGFSTSNN